MARNRTGQHVARWTICWPAKARQAERAMRRNVLKNRWLRLLVELSVVGTRRAMCQAESGSAARIRPSRTSGLSPRLVGFCWQRRATEAQRDLSSHVQRNQPGLSKRRYRSCDYARAHHGQSSGRKCCVSWLPMRRSAAPSATRIREQRKPLTRCGEFGTALTESAPTVTRRFRKRAFRLSLKLHDASLVRQNTNGAQPPVQELGSMLPDVRPDGTRWIGSSLRWFVYPARDPPRGSAVSGMESETRTTP